MDPDKKTEQLHWFFIYILCILTDYFWVKMIITIKNPVKHQKICTNLIFILYHDIYYFKRIPWTVILFFLLFDYKFKLKVTCQSNVTCVQITYKPQPILCTFDIKRKLCFTTFLYLSPCTKNLTRLYNFCSTQIEYDSGMLFPFITIWGIYFFTWTKPNIAIQTL